MNYRIDCFKHERIIDVYVNKYDTFSVSTRDSALRLAECLKLQYDEIYLMRYVITDYEGKDRYTVDERIK